MQILRLSICLDEDYPTIDWDAHIDVTDRWLLADDLHRSGQEIDEVIAGIQYRCRLGKRWPRIDCIDMGGGFAVSARAKGVLESLEIPGMRFLPFRINGEPWFNFYTDRVIDCLDRSRSVLDFFSPPSSRVMQVKRYRFLEHRIRPCDIFAIPELSDGMFFWSQETFFTDSACEVVKSSGLVGFRFEELP